jgi:hypothetical protein
MGEWKNIKNMGPKKDGLPYVVLPGDIFTLSKLTINEGMSIDELPNCMTSHFRN